MVVVRPAREPEIDTICEFLTTHMDSSVSKDRFRRLFTYPWMPEKPNLGFVLEDDGRLAGFISTIYADREVNGRIERFCNLSSWFVLPEYRNHSLSLLNAVHRQGDLVFTNLTSRPAVQKISLALRYQLLDTYKLFSLAGAHFWTLFRLPWPKLHTRPGEIEPLLEPAHRKLLRDHAETECGHLLASAGGRHCYIIWKRRVKHSVPFCELLFVSDPELLRAHFERIKLAICLHGGSLLMALDERLLGTRPPLLYPYERVTLFKAKRAGRMDVDNLYSELALL
jgi:hypothetical protein